MPRFRNNSGTTSAAKTNAAVVSFKSFGFRPQRSAIATSRRNNTDPISAPATTRPSLCAPTRASPMITLASPPHHDADSHLHIGEALVLRQQRAGDGHQSVRKRQAEHQHMAVIDPGGANHLRVVAGAAHGRP